MVKAPSWFLIYFLQPRLGISLCSVMKWYGKYIRIPLTVLHCTITVLISRTLSDKKQHPIHPYKESSADALLHPIALRKYETPHDANA